MRSIRITKRWVALGAVLAASVQMARADQPAFRADQFTEFVGISGSPLRFHVIADGPYAGVGKTSTPQVFYDLGVRHYRAGLFNDLTAADQPAQVRAAWETHGVRPMFLIDPGKTKTPEDVLAKLRVEFPAAEVLA